jgi:hypothetical protein
MTSEWLRRRPSDVGHVPDHAVSAASTLAAQADACRYSIAARSRRVIDEFAQARLKRYVIEIKRPRSQLQLVELGRIPAFDFLEKGAKLRSQPA